MSCSRKTQPHWSSPPRSRLARQSFGLAVPVIASYCDPAGKGTNTQTGESEFDLFARAGLRPSGKSSSVRDGCVRIMNALADEAQPLVIAERCVGLIRALSQIKPQRSSPEIYDTDHEIFSHPLDAMRYLLINLPQPAGEWDAPSYSGHLVPRIW